MKKNILTIVLALTALVGFSQTNPGSSMPKLGFGLNFGLPVTTGFGFLAGGLASLDYPVKSGLSATGSLGYSHLGYNSTLRQYSKAYGGNTGVGVVPFKVGMKKDLTNNLFIQGETGLAFGTGTSFILSPRIGFEKPLKAGALAFSARYELWAGGGAIHMFNGGIEYKLPLRIK